MTNMFPHNNKDTGTMSSGVFIVYFEHTPFPSVSNVGFERVNVCWKRKFTFC